MKRTSVLDFLGVMRIVGYSLALVAALIVVALYLAGLQMQVSRVLAAPFTGLVAMGLLVAWVAALSRLFVRRMRFASPQE